MRWRIHNLSTIVEEASADERRWIGEYLSFADRTYRKGAPPKDRRVSLFNQLTNEFPTGLGTMAYKQAKKNALEVEVVDARCVPCAPDPDADLEWLRHHPAVKGPITHQIEAYCIHRAYQISRARW